MKVEWDNEVTSLREFLPYGRVLDVATFETPELQQLQEERVYELVRPTKTDQFRYIASLFDGFWAPGESLDSLRELRRVTKPSGIGLISIELDLSPKNLRNHLEENMLTVLSYYPKIVKPTIWQIYLVRVNKPC